MKKIVLILLPLLLLLFTACEKEGKSYESYNLGIDLQETFDHDNVQVFIDGHLEFNRQATTNQLLGFAGGTATSRNTGNHQVKVVVNNFITKTAVFNLNANLFLGIKYSKQTGKISIVYSNQPFGYD